MKKGKKYTIYMVYAPDAPKKFFRNPYFSMNKLAALKHAKMMRECGYDAEMSVFFAPPCTFHLPAKKKTGFAKLDLIAA